MLILKVKNWYGHVILTTEHGKKDQNSILSL
jgi:hypothetical protein